MTFRLQSWSREDGRLIEVCDRLHATDLLQNANLVRSSPAFDNLRIRVELGNLHPANLDLFTAGRDAIEGAALSAGDRVGEGHVVFVGDEVLDGRS